MLLFASVRERRKLLVLPVGHAAMHQGGNAAHPGLADEQLMRRRVPAGADCRAGNEQLSTTVRFKPSTAPS